MGGGGKGGGVPHQFGPVLENLQNIMGQAQSRGFQFEQQFPLGLLGFNRDNQTQMLNQLAGTQLGVGNTLLGQTAPTFEAALGSLRGGMQEGFTGDLSQTVGQLGGILDASLRPSLQRSFETGEADIFEGAARSGTTRSSTTTDQIGRFREGLEAQLLQTVGGGQANLLGALAPLQAEQRQQATTMGLGLPGMAQQFLSRPQDFGMQSLLQGLQLPIQAGGAAGGALGGVPFQQGQNKAGDALALVGSAAAASAPYWGPMLFACWVARATGMRDWPRARRYVLYQAPAHIRNAYLRHGEAIAAWVATRPTWMRTALRMNFDTFLAARA